MSALALRSKAWWGYDAAFLERVRPSLAVESTDVRRHPIYVLERDGRTLGFYGLRILEGEPWLYDLWVDPPDIGSGAGRTLWNHLTQTARELGYGYFLIESDPNAEGFYLRMGARRVGEHVAPETGRRLPLPRVDCPAPPTG